MYSNFTNATSKTFIFFNIALLCMVYFEICDTSKIRANKYLSYPKKKLKNSYI
jgi:hypothetical protein